MEREKAHIGRGNGSSIGVFSFILSISSVKNREEEQNSTYDRTHVYRKTVHKIGKKELDYKNLYSGGVFFY